MATVFISYSRSDIDAARSLQDAIVATGLSCWRDERWLAPGDDFAVEITRAIRECSAFILLLSPASNSSDYVWKEIAVAHHFKKLIIPVLLAQTDIAEGLLPYLVRLHMWDLREHDASDVATWLRAKLGRSGEDRVASVPADQESAISNLDASSFGGPPVPLVTNLEYHAFMGESGRQRVPHWSSPKSRFPEDSGGSPATWVSWEDAVAYCDWAGSRLPGPGENLALQDAATAMAGTQAIYEWRDAGTERYKQVCDPHTSNVIAVMDRDTPRSNVGFRSIPVNPPAPRKWVRIDSGPCSLGSDTTAFTRLATLYGSHLTVSRPILNRDVRQYNLHDYAISVTSVTNEEYYAFTQATGRPWPRHWDAKWIKCSRRPFAARLACEPVVHVSAENAQAYCIWSRTRLPTWMEWERAASGPARRPYPWGPDYNAERCNSIEGGRGSLVGVDEYPLGDSPEGVRQLCGNVAEWVLDSHGQFELRGGSYRLPCELWGVVYAFRQTEPEFHARDVGFRVVSD